MSRLILPRDLTYPAPTLWVPRIFHAGYPCPPCCPTKWDCNDLNVPPVIYCNDAYDEYIADLDVGGWVNDNCDYCNQVAGEYTLAYNATDNCNDLADSVFYLDCSWCYEEENVCSGLGLDYNLILVLTFNTNVATSSWQYQLRVILWPDLWLSWRHEELFLSDWSDSHDCTALEDGNGKIEMNRDSFIEGSANQCEDGQRLPDPIYIWGA